MCNVMEDWAYTIECGKSVDVMYLDYSNAFNRVPHACLFSNCLHCNRIDGLHTIEMDQELSNRPETTSLC